MKNCKIFHVFRSNCFWIINSAFRIQIVVPDIELRTPPPSPTHLQLRYFCHVQTVHLQRRVQQRQQKTRVHDRRLYAQHLQSRYQPVRDCAHRTVTHQLRILHTSFVDDPQTGDQPTILCLSVRFGDFLGNPTHSFRKCRRCVARKITVCDSPRAWTTREWMGG